MKIYQFRGKKAEAYSENITEPCIRLLEKSHMK